ncbi:hypothetical protein CYMTET_12903 [Cymbomonas tetramitiformis]|uniref:Uncharacterized protein n=1 Tax=Cymbomonas tetramitiformis TaxID=36881 RepID=A0AAE0GKS2_9CHLO|nr:hypothetical protein CYMTET_12903 [Cymbomonas tetramitiformis]|eukprot:gene11254-13301_t
MEKYKALREDLTLKMSIGDVQCEVLHQGKEFWVVNKYPWYAAGVHQCICTQAHEGGDKSKPAVYPVQYNWTQQMFYIGREKIGIEYVNEVRVLDHWAWGPHHAWSEPSNGTLVRLWQPFNGLQIFGDVTGANPGTVDEKVFQDIPPALCKKGGATFRINCDDDGYYKPKKDVNEQLASSSVASLQDIKRAKTVVPRKDYRGINFQNMSAVLNNWIASGSATFRACDDWNLDELQKLQAMLYLVRNADFDSIYTPARDNRRLVNETLEDIKATWADLNKLVEGHPAESKLKNIVRDAHCHESVMWYVHHLSEDTKNILGETGIEIPLLSLAPHHEDGGACAQSQQDETHQTVCRLYEEKVSCAACHSNALPPKETKPGRKARFNL